MLFRAELHHITLTIFWDLRNTSGTSRGPCRISMNLSFTLLFRAPPWPCNDWASPKTFTSDVCGCTGSDWVWMFQRRTSRARTVEPRFIIIESFAETSSLFGSCIWKKSAKWNQALDGTGWHNKCPSTPGTSHMPVGVLVHLWDAVRQPCFTTGFKTGH